MRVLALLGPNLSRMGRRDPHHYGRYTLATVRAAMDDRAMRLAATVRHYQGNGEGEAIDWLQRHQDDADAVVANPASLSTYSVALRDALYESGLDLAIVHLSNLLAREEWRRADIFGEIAHVYLAGTQSEGFVYALDSLANRYEARRSGQATTRPVLSRELPVIHHRRWADLDIAP